MNNRGSVILHVLVTGVVVAFISAMLLRMTMFRYVVTARSHKSAQMKRYTEAVLAQLNSAWAGGQTCANFGNYTCAGATVGFCGCTCTSAGVPSILTAPSGSAPCQITISSPDLAPAP